MNILLTGATGGLGYRTLEKLILNSQINKIIASGRIIKPSHFIKHDKVRYELGNLFDQKYTTELVTQVDHIIHAAALSSPWGKNSDFEIANIFSMNNLLASSKLVGIKRFIYISTASVYFNYRNRLNVKETDMIPEKFVNAYAKTKYDAELALIKSAIPFIILRPRALIGRGDTVIMPRLIRAYKEGKLKIIGNGENIVDLTSLFNMASAIELSLSATGKGVNQIYNISNGEPAKLWEVTEQVLSLLGYEMAKTKVPYAFVKLIAHLLEMKAKLTDNDEPALTTYSAGTLAKSFTMDISKAKELLGYVPAVSNNDAIMEFVNWYKQNERS